MTANVDPLSSKTIDESSVPLWTLSLRKQLTSPPYRCGWSSAKHQRTIPRQSSWHHPLLPKEVITLYRDRRTKTKSSAALEEHRIGFVAEQEMTPPRIMQPCARDRRVYPVGSMRRDTVRRRLQLEDLRLEFVVVRLDLTDPDGATQTMLVFAPHGTPSVLLDVFLSGVVVRPVEPRSCLSPGSEGQCRRYRTYE